MRAWSVEHFAINLKSLKLFRVALGLGVFFDLWTKLARGNADAFFLSLLKQRTTESLGWIHWINPYFHVHEPIGFYSLIFIHGIFAISFTLGYRVRTAAFLTFLFQIALQQRNPDILHLGDGYLSTLMLTALFLPFQKSYDDDGRFEVAGWSTFFLTLQISIIYFISALYKLNEPIWREGFGVYYALSSYEYTTWGVNWILSFPLFVKGLNYLTITMELLAPVFLIVSVRKHKGFRYAFIGVAAALHAGLWVGMGIGAIQIYGLISLLAFLPSELWRKKAELIVLKAHYSEWLAKGFAVFILILNCGLLSGRIANMDSPIRRLTHRPEIVGTGLAQAWSVYTRPIVRSTLVLNFTEKTNGPGEVAAIPFAERQVGRAYAESVDTTWGQRLAEENLPVQLPALASVHYGTSVIESFSDMRWGRYFMTINLTHLERHLPVVCTGLRKNISFSTESIGIGITADQLFSLKPDNASHRLDCQNSTDSI